MGWTIRPQPRLPGSTCGRTRRSLRLLDELEGWSELGGELSAEELVGALERAPVRAGSARPGHVAIVDLQRARTRALEVVFVLGLEEGVLPQRAEAPRSSTTTAAASSTAAPGCEAGRSRVARAGTCSTRRAPGRRGGSTSYARRRPTTGRRASPARSGRTPAPCSTRTTSRGGRAGAPSRSSSGRSTARRPSASGCAALAALGQRSEAAAAIASANGWERRARPRAQRLQRPTGYSSPPSSRQLRGASDLRRHRAGDVRRLLLDLVRRAAARPEIDGRGGGRAHARVGRPPGALQVSSPDCRNGSTRSGARPTGWTRRSSSSASASPRRSQAAPSRGSS